jgi:hypothetical protein
MRFILLLGLAGFVFLTHTPLPCPACDLCPNQGLPLSQEIKRSRAAVLGSVVNARLGADPTSGTSDLRIEAVIKNDPAIQGKTTVTLPRYVPPDPKLKFLVTLELIRGQLDVFRGIAVSSDRIVKYLQDAPAKPDEVTPEKGAERLRYFFPFLNDADSEIAADAFKEWATSSNREVGLIASKLPPDNLRTWLLDKKTPAHRLSLYGFLLGACGNDSDAEMLRRFILNPDERMAAALDGLLAGYIHLRGPVGWKLTEEVLADTQRPFTQRHSVLRMLRFYHGFEPEKTRPQLLRCARIMLEQVEMVDLGVTHLRRWQIWDETPQVLKLYGTKLAEAPITSRAIVLYALACPRPEAKTFVEKLQATNPMLVEEMRESLQFDQPAKAKN